MNVCHSRNIFNVFLQGYIGLISRVRKYLNPAHNKMLFNVIVLPHFGYCSHLWTNASKIHLDIINKLHRRSGRILIQVPKRTPTEEVLLNLK